MLEGRGEGEEFAERILAEEILLHELLHMLRRRAARARLEQAAAIHQRDDREHLGTRADFEDGEEVRQVIAKHIARDRDRVVAGLEAD